MGNYIKSRGGVVAAEELAPFLDHPKGYSTSDPDSNDESYIVPALVRFGGSPEVDDQGNLLYHFPSLQVSVCCFFLCHPTATPEDSLRHHQRGNLLVLMCNKTSKSSRSYC